MLFIKLQELYPKAIMTQSKLKFWQSQSRHELRIQNMPPDEIEALFIMLNSFWPLASKITLEVF